MNLLTTNDSLRSLTSGMGDPLHDKAAGVFHQDRILSDLQLMSSYRNSWIAGKIVDIPATDALRKGRDWQASQDDITKIEREEKRLGLWRKMLECKIKARLWGGAAVVIGTADGSDYSKPFEFEKVKKGGIAYLTVMTRRELSAGALTTDVGSEFYAKPEFYTAAGLNNAFVQIHPSRLIVQYGSPHPDAWLAGGSAYGWADSTLQRVYDTMMNADSTSANVASLVFEANVDSFGIPDLMEKLSSAEYEQRLLNRLTLAKVGKSVTKSLVHDTEETYQRHTINFSGLPDVVKTSLLVASGASYIPLTRFLGQSPSGLSSTGEGDMKNYHEWIASIQTMEIEPAMYRFDEALIRSALGDRPEEIYYTWTPLEQVNEKDQAEIGLKSAQTAEILTRTGLFDQEELREAVSNQLIENGFYPGLADTMKATPDFNLGQNEPTPPATAKPAPVGVPVTADAAPMTLYMRRDVLNAAEIGEWYRSQGVKKVYAPESMHVTVVYSKKPIDWMKFGEPWEATLEIKEGGPRINEKFGDAGDVLVLQFAGRELNWRHEQAKDLGGSFDFDEYQPHISITLESGDVDLKTLKPWTGKIILGPEIYEEVKEGDWRKSVVTGDLLK